MKQLAFKNVGAVPDDFESFPVPAEDAGLPGVYRVLANHQLPRVVGESPILYVGSAAILGRRLSPLHGVLQSLQRLRERYPTKIEFTLEISAFPEHSIPWNIAREQWVRFIESTVLAGYQQAHLELPPFNSRSEGDVVMRSLSTLGDALTRFRIGIKSFARPTDEDEHALTTLGLELREGQDPTAPAPQLFWTWPTTLWTDGEPWWAPHLRADSLYLVMESGNALRSSFPALSFSAIKVTGSDRPWVAAPLGEEGWQRELESGSFDRILGAVDNAIRSLRAGIR